MSRTSSADIVFQSYGRCCQQEHFFADFYKLLHDKSNEIAKKFAHTNMPRQKELLREGLLWMVMFTRGGSAKRINEFAKSHSRNGFDIHPNFYIHWVDALMEAIKKHDPQYTEQLEAEWREALEPGIKVMQDAW